MENPSSSPTVRLRPPIGRDAAAIAALTSELGYPVDAETMRRRLQAVEASDADFLRVAVDAAGDPVGWVQAHFWHVLESGSRVDIVGLIVSPSARRSGVGRALVAEAEHWAREKNVAAIYVRSNAKRIESHAFYPALGFALTKTQHAYRKPLATG